CFEEFACGSSHFAAGGCWWRPHHRYNRSLGKQRTQSSEWDWSSAASQYQLTILLQLLSQTIMQSSKSLFV
ncbi:unnamed protein product, partial [Urochloa humidicola]